MGTTTARAIRLLAVLLAGSGAAQAQQFGSGEWIDLTHVLNEQSVFWPTAKMFEKETVFEGRTDAGFYYSAFNFSAAEHGGTHVDAPIHFAEGRLATNEIAVDRMIGPAVVIDVKAASAQDPDYRVAPKDITDWEAEHGRIPDGAILLFNTGYARHYPDREKYMGTAARGQEAVADLHFPGIHPATAAFLVGQRDVAAVGLDTPSIDYGQSTDFAAHVTLYRNDIPGLENVASLDGLPPTGATVIALPMKIEGGSGGPVRIVAFVPDA